MQQSYHQGLIKELIRLIDDQQNRVQDKILTSKLMLTVSHIREFEITLEGIRNGLENISEDDYYGALAVLLTAAKSLKLSYIVSERDGIVTYESGEAEAYRFSIQTLVNLIESDYFYRIRPDQEYVVKSDARKKASIIREAFYHSPFSYDCDLGFLRDNIADLRGEPNTFPRKNIDNLEVGDVIEWQE